VCFLCLSFINAQVQLSGFLTQTGFNMTTATDLQVHNNYYLSYNFISTDAPTTQYSLKLVAIFEATNVGGKLTQVPGSILTSANYAPVLPLVPPATNLMSTNMTLNFAANKPNPMMNPLQNLVFNHFFLVTC